MKYKWRQWKQLEKEISERNPKMLDLSSEAARKSWHLSPSPGDPCYLAAASPGEEELGTALPGAPPPPLQEEEPSPTDPNYVKIDEFAVSEVTAAAGDDGRGRRIGVGRRQISLRQIPHRQIPLRQIPIRQIPLTKIQTPINVTPANLTLTNPTLPFSGQQNPSLEKFIPSNSSQANLTLANPNPANHSQLNPTPANPIKSHSSNLSLPNPSRHRH